MSLDQSRARPYFNASIESLEEAFAQAEDDVATLRGLLSELSYRKTERAKALKQRVVRRLDELAAMRTRGADSEGGTMTRPTDSHQTGLGQQDQGPANVATGEAREAREPRGEEAPRATDSRVIAESLEQIRQRLLDLTRRNVLLNYTHPSKRSLRVVDELPDQLFSELLADKALVFAPLPRVPSLEEPVSERIRSFLEAQRDPKKPPATEWAKFHGIDPSLELPAPESREAKHQDARIQTLLLPAELETRLKHMSQLARTAIEESGANILYMAFGFLQWREADYSEETSLAPLLLVPVSLKKEKGLDKQTRRERFTLEYSGEDLQVNLSLRERLRRDFALQLPELEDEDTPEAYMQRCRTLLIDQPRWSIHRHVTLGFFQFGKLLMYLDLDPERWPREASITEHPIVYQLLCGDVQDATDDGAALDVDKIPLDVPEAQLIEEADSSQHAAIVEAAKGRNLVIEGPPGTGKSQTITNIIGVALAQGRTVLFVSEKLAALEVVKSRLEAAGLGHLCLELHSHKTQKRKFIDDVAVRLAKRASRPNASRIAKERERWQHIRDEVAEHLRLVNREVAGYDGAYRHLFCETAWLRRRLSSLHVTVDPTEVRKDDAQDLLYATERASSAANHARANVRSACGSMASHPWHGLIMRTGGTEAHAASAALGEWRLALNELVTVAAPLPSIQGMPHFEAYGTLRRTALLARKFEKDLYRHFRVAEAVRQLGALSALDKLVAWEFKIRGKAEQAAGHWRLEGRPLEEVWEEVEPLGAALLTDAFDLRESTIDELGELQHGLEQLEAQVDVLAAGTLQVAKILGSTVSPDVAGLELAQKLLQLGAARPRQALSVRSKTVQTIEDLEALRGLVEERRELLEERASLSLQFDTSERFNVERLKAIRQVFARAGLFAFLSAEYRSANGIYQALRHSKVRFRTASRKAADVERLHTFQAVLDAYLNNDAYARLLGTDFHGLETPAEDILKVAEWNHAVRAALGSKPDMAGLSGRKLIELEEAKLDELDALQRSELPHVMSFGLGALDRITAINPDLSAFILRNGWQGLPEACRAVLRSIEAIVQGLFARLRDAHRQSPMITSLRVLERAVHMLRVPKRHELHQQLLEAATPGVWGDEMLASGRQLAAILRELESETADSPVRHALALVDPETRDIGDLLRRIADACHRCDEACERVHQHFSIAVDFAGSSVEQAHWASLGERLTRAEATDAQAVLWREIARAVDLMVSLEPGFEQLRAHAFRADLPDEGIALAARYLVLDRKAREAIQTFPKLDAFNSGTHEELIVAFKDADEQLKQISRALITAAADGRPVPHGRTGARAGDYTELQLLRRETNKQMRHLPIRVVMQRAGQALQALKPCFMMGPLSAAQYLEPGRLSFDVVIMDEASQMRPEDALGAVARGSQLIVVGDPKQLPPTSFFDRMAEDDVDDSDEELAFGGQESILDIAMPIYAPSRTLAWHYRSQHEKLIAFSNHSFYNKRLLLFPTAHASAEHLGVRYFRVKGTYSSHTNVKEAQELVRAVVREVRAGRGRSIGIAAINSAQAQVIRDEWDRVTRELPDLRELLYEEENGLESLFIKNLENVQGDERDVIFISLTYGPDENGKFYNRFGPINRDQGWRRLNVLLTRAKQQMNVFSSMDSEMITPGTGAKRGVIALKDFLSFCETGVLPEAAEQTGRAPESPFEQDVAAAVRDFGLDVHCQVGVAGFFIDIGVVDPEAPGQYLLGIECDGASYHSESSVRDRDKIRQEILEKLGWRIHRVWSTDWFKSEVRERQRMHNALEHARAEAIRRREALSAAQVVAQSEADEASARLLRLQERDPTIVEEAIADAGDMERQSDLRQRLLELRTTIDDEFPDTPASKRLLSDDIVDILVAVRPKTLFEFHASVPLERRQQIDVKQSAAYLSTILVLIDDSS